MGVPAPISVAVPTCPRCGAALALDTRAHVQCPYCKADAELPERSRTALELTQQGLAADANAQALFRKLGKPQTLPLTLWGLEYALVTFFFAVGWVGWISPALKRLAASVALHAFHANLFDVSTSRDRELVSIALLTVLCLAMVLIGAWNNGRLIKRAALAAALTAKPPTLPGGPAHCRQCGAPLSVPENAVGVRCAFCQSDNLVAIPQAWLDKARRRLGALISETTSVAEQAERSRRSRLRQLVTWPVLSLAGCGLLALAAVIDLPGRTHDSQNDLRAALGDRLLLGHRQDLKLTDQPMHFQVTGLELECNSDHDVPVCEPVWFVALRAGETLSVALDAPGDAELWEHQRDEVRLDGLGRTHFLSLGWGRVVASERARVNQTVALRAPDTAWYALRLALPDIQSKGLDLAVSVARE